MDPTCRYHDATNHVTVANGESCPGWRASDARPPKTGNTGPFEGRRLINSSRTASEKPIRRLAEAAGGEERRQLRRERGELGSR
jgi:hypothetical protein